MLNNENQFEIVYKPLTTPESAHAASVYISRARAAMVSSNAVRTADSPVFFSRTADGAGFSVRSASRETLESLPLSYGSPVGHFGIFQRGEVRCELGKSTCDLHFKSASAEGRSHSKLH